MNAVALIAGDVFMMADSFSFSLETIRVVKQEELLVLSKLQHIS